MNDAEPWLQGLLPAANYTYFLADRPFVSRADERKVFIRGAASSLGASIIALLAWVAATAASTESEFSRSKRLMASRILLAICFDVLT